MGKIDKGLARRLAALWLWLAACLLAAAPVAQEEERSSAIYIPLAPPFVVNYGGQGRLKYLKAELSVRVERSGDAELVRHHMPLLRNTLIMMFSRQDEEAVSTRVGRERLRELALEEVNDLIETEEGERPVRELYFNNFVVQQ